MIFKPLPRSLVPPPPPTERPLVRPSDGASEGTIGTPGAPIEQVVAWDRQERRGGGCGYGIIQMREGAAAPSGRDACLRAGGREGDVRTSEE